MMMIYKTKGNDDNYIKQLLRTKINISLNYDDIQN